MPVTNPFHPFEPPFKFDGEAYIWDSVGNIVFQVRGWGRLIHRYPVTAERVKRQNEIGELVARLMNNYAMQEGQ